MKQLAQCDQYRDLLAWYVAGTLTDNETASIAQHLLSCLVCQQELAHWRGIAALIHDESSQKQAPVIQPFTSSWNAFGARLATVNQPSPLQRFLDLLNGWREATYDLLIFQVRFICSEFWIIQGIALIIAILLLFPPISWEHRTIALQFLMGLQAAIGIILLFWERSSLDTELTPTTVVLPHLLVSLRLLILAVTQTILNGCTALLFALAYAISPFVLLTQWLAPLCFLVALGFFLSTIMRPLIALFIVLTLWSIRMLLLLPMFDTIAASILYEHFWSSGPFLTTCTFCIFACSFLLLKKERFV